MDERVLARFWKKVDRSGDCWLWTAGKMKDGYGIFRVRSYESMQLAHRVSWEIHHGEAPRQWVLHHCDVRLCVNPAHLFEGDVKDNAVDMARKLRGSNTLTPEQVRLVRDRCARGESQGSVSRDLGVGQATVSRIVNRVCWAWLE